MSESYVALPIKITLLEKVQLNNVFSPPMMPALNDVLINCQAAILVDNFCNSGSLIYPDDIIEAKETNLQG